jgi:gluconokinase
MNHVVLGLDLGTTHIKAVLLRTDGKVLLGLKERIPTIRSAHPIAEQDVGIVWQVVVRILQQIANNSEGIKPEAIGISGAMQSLQALDKNYLPVSQAWIWSDFRAMIEADEIRKSPLSSNFYIQTGCPLQPVYHPARLLWIQNHNPTLFAKTAFWVGIKDYIIYQLTGDLCTDSGMASSTGLLNIFTVQWNVDLLGICGLYPRQLPEILSPSDLVGSITSETSSLTGLPAGMPVYAGSTDGALANYGAGAREVGDTVVSVATGLAVRIASKNPWPEPLQRTWSYLFRPGEFIVGGAGNSGGYAIQWIREQFYRDLPDDVAYHQIFQDAESIKPGADGVRFEPYFNGNRTPHWQSNMTAKISGLKVNHSRENIARAALEGIAREVGDIWDILKESRLPREPILLSGTFCTQPVWTQILQSQLGVSVKPVDLPDASAVGAAKLVLELF